MSALEFRGCQMLVVLLAYVADYHIISYHIIYFPSVDPYRIT